MRPAGQKFNIAFLILIALVNYLASRLGFLFALENGNISLVWPQAGVALALLLLFGRRVLPGLWLGILVANVSNETPLLASAGIASGSTLMTYVGAHLLERVNFQAGLRRVHDVLSLVMFGMIFSPVISATIGVICLSLAGLLPISDVPRAWFTWWLGDGMGILLVAPVILIWMEKPRLKLTHRGWIEALTLITLLGAAVG